ncbi:MAG: UMP kinase [Nanoarchaeota archaeon]
MQKKVMVLSLGGSLIIPDNVDVKFLKEFKKVILKNSQKYKFIIVCGGGSIARKYIAGLREIGADQKLQSLSGISATRMNARFMNYFFGIDSERGIPHKIQEIKNLLQKRNVIFCGGLEYKPNQTSDGTSAEIANYFSSEFINLTNVKGLYDKNPKKFKDAKFISKITWKNFDKIANKSKFEPGQHFVLDQSASKIILKNKIKTYIIGSDPKQLDNLLNNKKFVGTIIEG